MKLFIYLNDINYLNVDRVLDLSTLSGQDILNLVDEINSNNYEEVLIYFEENAWQGLQASPAKDYLIGVMSEDKKENISENPFSSVKLMVNTDDWVLVDQNVSGGENIDPVISGYPVGVNKINTKIKSEEEFQNILGSLENYDLIFVKT